MIIIVPEPFFTKKAKKLVVAKDFLIVDATDDYDSKLSEFGNRTPSPELTPTPVLKKIILDPDSTEAKIKRRNMKHYIENWLEDEGLLMRILFCCDMMCTVYENTGEDMNIFIVMRKKEYAELGGVLKERIDRATTKDFPVAYLLTKNTPKEEREKILNKKMPREFWGKFRKVLEKWRKEFDKSQLAQLYHSV